MLLVVVDYSYGNEVQLLEADLMLECQVILVAVVVSDQDVLLVDLREEDDLAITECHPVLDVLRRGAAA